MENQEKLQYIKNKVIEVCPEVMEIMIGTEVLITHNLAKFQGKVLYQNVGGTTVANLATGMIEILTLPEQFEIVGNPIGLSHILRTIQHKGMFSLTDMGEFLNDVGDKRFTNIFWNLEKDSLDQQKPEVIDYLYTLLK